MTKIQRFGLCMILYLIYCNIILQKPLPSFLIWWLVGMIAIGFLAWTGKEEKK